MDIFVSELEKLNELGKIREGLNSYLYFNTKLPPKFVDILKLYYIPIIFSVYFVYDLTRNIPKIDRFWKRLFQKTEFSFSNIIDGNVTHEDLEFYLLTVSFNSHQLETIFKKLIETKQFTPKAQINIFRNKKIHRIDTFQVLREYIINFDWNPSAICEIVGKAQFSNISALLSKLDWAQRSDLVLTIFL